MNAAISVFSSKRAAGELTGTLDQFIPDSTVSLSTEKHNLCGGLGPLAVLSWSFSTLIPLFSLSLALPLSPTYPRWRDWEVWKVERPPIQMPHTDRHLQHNSPEEERVSHLETSSAAHYQLLGTYTQKHIHIQQTHQDSVAHPHNLWFTLIYWSTVLNYCRAKKACC